MRLSSLAIIAATFATAAGAALVAAGFSVSLIEEKSTQGVREALEQAGKPWAEVQTDGLEVHLTGTAPTEAERFKALSIAGGVVDAARVIDMMSVAEAEDIAPPHFSIEILRNDSGISLIGLVPAQTDREALIEEVAELAGDLPVTDLLESADYDVPAGWNRAIDFSMDSLRSLPRSKISVDAENISIKAISESAAEKQKLETELTRSAPKTLTLELDIAAPRPVITPFTLRFVIDETGARFDACSAETEAARARILKAATAAGASEQAGCTIGLGVPSKNWPAAVEQAIAALAEIGAGSVTFSDADVSLMAAEGTSQATFDKVVGELENDLPDTFALHSVLIKAPDADDEGPPEFSATLSPEGVVEMRGRLTDEILRESVSGFAKARFSNVVIDNAARLDDSLPTDWPVRVFSGLQALSRLVDGTVTITADKIRISGNTGDPDAGADIARVLSEKLGENAHYDIDIAYQKKLDPVLNLPTPEECETQIAAILKLRKINFEPGSDAVDADGRGILDDIAGVLHKCEDVPFEIGGHTDSQGRDSMNLELSQSRAQSVLNELRARRVLTAKFVAKGYGEDQPIAGNDSEEGREANRRIEFKLIREKPAEEEEDDSALESAPGSGSEDAGSEDQATGDDSEQN